MLTLLLLSLVGMGSGVRILPLPETTNAEGRVQLRRKAEVLLSIRVQSNSSLGNTTLLVKSPGSDALV